MDVNVREAKEPDVEAIVSLFVSAYKFHSSRAPEIFAPVEETLDMRKIVRDIMASPDADLLVALVDGAVAGVSHVRVETFSPESGFRDSRVAKIADLFVAEPVRVRGVGRLLVAASEEWAQKKGLPEIQLMVWDFNSAADAFYRRIGYAPRARIMGKRFS